MDEKHWKKSLFRLSMKKTVLRKLYSIFQLFFFFAQFTLQGLIYLSLEYPVLSLVSTLFNMTPVLFSVDAGVDTEQRWIFLKNIIISLIWYLHIVNNIFKLISHFVFTL